MKVFICLMCEPHEGGTIVAVFDNKRAANKYAKDFNSKSSFDYITVSEWEVGYACQVEPYI